ncbi:type I-E CRISPR-associated protein Cse2/CasB [Streptomyces sp. NPDC001904]|uniref:type I-E CRISPR-associated protein Cse2/CasB n=1 Tax=Streptomyces sp. NPDC001904 TaxID=3154531 RepID=UPI003318238F
MSSVTDGAPTVRTRVAALAASHITPWQLGYLADRPKDVAALARLRRGAGRPAGAMPDLWTLIDTTNLHAQPEDGRPLRESELVRAEDALHTAVTLWALHQQSRPTGMHRPHASRRPSGLGAAVRRLMPPGEIDDAVRKRLVRAGSAADLTSLSQRLRDLVVLLRRADISLDYGLLAGQLYAWQWPGGPDQVRTEWGRSFHAWQAPAADPQTVPTEPGPLTGPDSDKDTL